MFAYFIVITHSEYILCARCNKIFNAYGEYFATPANRATFGNCEQASGLVPCLESFCNSITLSSAADETICKSQKTNLAPRINDLNNSNYQGFVSEFCTSVVSCVDTIPQEETETQKYLYAGVIVGGIMVIGAGIFAYKRLCSSIKVTPM